MVEGLIATILSLATWLSPQQARIHVEAAVQASEETGIEAETLLAMAYLESRYIPNVVSHLRCEERCEVGSDNVKRCALSCQRRGGRIRSGLRPHNWRPTFFCGPVQVTAKSWKDCKDLTIDISSAYSRAADHLRGWITHGDRRLLIDSDARLIQGLAGYAGGFKSLRNKHYSYPRRVIKLRNRIKRLTKEHESRRLHSADI